MTPKDRDTESKLKILMLVEETGHAGSDLRYIFGAIPLCQAGG